MPETNSAPELPSDAEMKETFKLIEDNAQRIFSWKYDRERDQLVTLYNKAMASQWNSVTELDWATEVDPEQLGGPRPDLVGEQHLAARRGVEAVVGDLQAALVGDLEPAHLLDRVPPELDPDRVLLGGREDVEDAAAHGELAPLLHHVHPGIGRRHERLGDLGEGTVLSRPQRHRFQVAQPLDHRLQQRANAGHHDPHRPGLRLGVVRVGQAAQGGQPAANRVRAGAEPFVRQGLPGGEGGDDVGALGQQVTEGSDEIVSLAPGGGDREDRPLVPPGQGGDQRRVGSGGRGDVHGRDTLARGGEHRRHGRVGAEQVDDGREGHGDPCEERQGWTHHSTVDQAPRWTPTQPVGEDRDVMSDARWPRPLPRRSAMTLASAAVAGLLAVGPVAWAEAPINLPGPVTDRADVLSPAQEEAAQEQIEALQQDTGLQLFVVFVDEFNDPSGASVNGVDWARSTFEESGMGHGDVVLAVAVEQRAYGLGDAGGTLPQQAFQRVQLQDVEPRLGADDWAGAVEGAVDGLAREHGRAASGQGGGITSDRPVRTPSSGGLGGFPGSFFLPLLIGGGGILAIRTVSRANRRPASGTPVPPSAQGISLQDLERQSAEALVGMDNAVRSAEEELAFAEAQFGRQRTEQFREVLERAKTSAKEAFSLRQQLDDDDREPDDVRRSMLARIIELTSQARRTLDEHTQEFATLRALQDRAPEFLAELTTRARETRDRLPTAEQEIKGLAARHPREALATVRAHLEQATGLLDSADGFIVAGQRSLDRDDRPSAVAAARAAEESVGQAASLLDAISRADSDLASAAEQLSRGIASLSADLQDAQRLAPNEPVVGQAVQRAREAIEAAQAVRSSGDPLRALADLDVAEHDLDTLLEPMRERETHATKMRENFTERFTRVGARLQSINQTIATRRGAISSGARTRMSEALRLYEEARTAGSNDPQTAMALLTRAEQLGEQALTEANNDLGSWGGSGGSGGGGGIDPWSVILGGILLGGNRGGGRRHSGGWGGSWGGGGGFSGGSFGGGSFGGGSFGGGGGGGGGSFTGGRF